MTHEETLGYCYGFFDGEGTICICQNTRRRTAEFSLQISAGQKQQGPLLILKSKFGGAISTARTRGISHCYHWRLTGRANQRRFLEEGLKYLCVKKPEAQIGLQFLDLLRPGYSGVRRPNLSEAQKEIRRQLWLSSKALRRSNGMISDRGQLEFPVTLKLLQGGAT